MKINYFRGDSTNVLQKKKHCHSSVVRLAKGVGDVLSADTSVQLVLLEMHFFLIMIINIYRVTSSQIHFFVSFKQNHC